MGARPARVTSLDDGSTVESCQFGTLGLSVLRRTNQKLSFGQLANFRVGLTFSTKMKFESKSKTQTTNYCERQYRYGDMIEAPQTEPYVRYVVRGILTQTPRLRCMAGLTGLGLRRLVYLCSHRHAAAIRRAQCTLQAAALLMLDRNICHRVGLECSGPGVGTGFEKCPRETDCRSLESAPPPWIPAA
jgi:hypothetical protein